MKFASEPYLQIESIGIELRLWNIDARRMLRAGTYGFYVGDGWIELDASEPYISTSGPSVRGFDLQAFGAETERLLHLVGQLRASGGLVQMRDAAGEEFKVSYKGVVRSFQVTGEFLIKGDNEEFQCRITFPDHEEFITTAIDKIYRGKRILLLGNLPLDVEFSLVRTVVEGSKIIVERIPWLD